jgi:hypothetical protein
MAGLPDKFQVVKCHDVAFSQNLRDVTSYQSINVGTLLLPYLNSEDSLCPEREAELSQVIAGLYLKFVELMPMKAESQGEAGQ